MQHPQGRQVGEPGNILTAAGREVYSLLKNPTHPKAPSTLLFADLKDLLLKHLIPANFEAIERARFHSLVRDKDMKIRDLVLQIYTYAVKCDLGDQFYTQSRDRLFAGINDCELQKPFLSKLGLSYTEAREICEPHADITATTTQFDHNLLSASRDQQKSPRNSSTTISSQFTIKPGKPTGNCYSCGESHVRDQCRFRNATCHSCGKVGHIKKV